MQPVSEVLKHRAWLLRLAQRLCGNSADADDHVQDVLMKYYDSFPEGKGAPPDDLRRMAWLSTTLRNHFRTSLRKKLVRVGASVDPTLESSMTPDEPPEPDSFTTVTGEEFGQAVGCLTEKQRRVLELSQQGKPQAETARELGIRVGAVAKRLFDARQRLRAELEQIIAARKGSTP